jgi:uroporphyrinogen decarboxylase
MLSYGGNIASAKMVGAEFFREYVFAYEKRLIDYIQSRGGRVLYHNCGYARNLFPLYHELGMHAYESLTPPPQGDTALEEALDVIGPEAVLHGGIDQIRFLMSARSADVKAKVRGLLDVARTRDNYIPGTSDYFHEDTPHENIAAMAEAGREFGRR